MHEILDDDHMADAAQLVKRYYEPLTSTRRPRSGAYFDEWAQGGDVPGVAMELTAEDFVAVSMLAVNVPAEAATGLKTRLDEVLERSEVPNKPSRLRVMDVVLWLHAKDLEWAKQAG